MVTPSLISATFLLQRAASSYTAVTAIKNDHPILNLRLICHGHDFGQWHAIVSSLHVRRAKVATCCFDVAMACEIQ